MSTIYTIVSAALTVSALGCGVWAALLSRRAAAVEPDFGWTPPGHPGLSEPVLPELRQSAIHAATLTALARSGDLNRQAVHWTITAVVLGAFANLLGLTPLAG